MYIIDFIKKIFTCLNDDDEYEYYYLEEPVKYNIDSIFLY